MNKKLDQIWVMDEKGIWDGVVPTKTMARKGKGKEKTFLKIM